MAAFATEVKVDIENGFGTWKVKLNVNIFRVSPGEDREAGKEGRKRMSGKWVGDSKQRTKIRKNDVSRDRRKGRRGWGLTFVIVNVVVRQQNEPKPLSGSLRTRVSTCGFISFANAQ